MARRKRGSFINKQAHLTIGERTKRALIWVGALLGVVVVLVIAAYFYLLSWLQGDSCRAYLAGLLRDKTAAKAVTIPENLSVSGSHLTLPSCTLQASPLFNELSINKLHLEIQRSALLRRVLRLNHFSVEEMRMGFQWTGNSAAAPARTAVATPQASSDALAAAVAGAATSILPAPTGSFLKDIQLKSFESHYTDTAITLNDKQFSLTGYHLIAVPRTGSGRTMWNISIDNGRILTPFSWLRESGIKSATLNYRGEDIQLKDCKIELAPGHLNAEGIYLLKNKLWKARVDIKQANVARILNDDWRKRLTGELHGSMEMKGDANNSSWEAHGELQLKKGVLEGLPILSDLNINSATPYRTIKLDKATCHVTYPYAEPEHGLLNAWLWDRIDIRGKDGLFLLRGRVITGTDGALSGTLSVGIPQETIAKLGLSNTPLVSKLFNAPEEAPGYVWVRINLSGTLSAPQEDFSVRLATVLPESLPQMAGQAINTLGSALNSFMPGIIDTQEKGEDKTPDTKDTTEPKPEDSKRPKRNDKVRDIINSGLDMIF